MYQKLKISVMGSWFKITTILMLLALVGVSCSRDNDVLQEQGNIRINLKGIKENIATNKLGKLASTNGLRSEDVNNFEVQAFDGADLFVESSLPKEGDTKGVEKLATVPPRTDYESIGADVKYVVAFYTHTLDPVDSRYVNHYVVTGAEQPIIHLPDGSYKWVAFSFNSNEAIDFNAIVDNDSKNLLPAAIANKDLIYTSGTVTTNGQHQYLNIEFERMTSKVDFLIDVRGMFGRISSTTQVFLKVNGQSDVVKSVIPAFDLLTGLTTETLGTIEIDLHAQNLEDVYGDKSVMKTSFHVYPQHVIFGTNITNNNITPHSLALEIPNLDVKLDEYTSMWDDKVKTPTRKFDNVKIALKHTTKPFNIGVRYEIQANFVESAINVGGVKWARSNLWYDESSTQLNKYRFRVHPHQRVLDANANSEYWKYGSSTPNGANSGIDPCKLVYPSGLWRMPTIEEFKIFGHVVGDLLVPDQVIAPTIAPKGAIVRRFKHEIHNSNKSKTFTNPTWQHFTRNGLQIGVPTLEAILNREWSEYPLQVVLKMNDSNESSSVYTGDQEKEMSGSEMSALYFPLMGIYRENHLPNTNFVMMSSYREINEREGDTNNQKVEFDRARHTGGYGYYYALKDISGPKESTNYEYDFYEMFIARSYDMPKINFPATSENAVSEILTDEIKLLRYRGAARKTDDDNSIDKVEYNQYKNDRMMIRCVRNN